MEPIEPLISSSVTGPLGITHLPRLWLKILLAGLGRLPDGYRMGEGGFDGALFEKFGIDGAAFIAFVRTTRPDYLTLEKWVVANARDLSPHTITSWNTHTRAAQLGAQRAEEWRTRFGIADPAFAHGISLNDLDDWASFHARVTAT